MQILVPYHLDERLTEVDAPITPDVTITEELPDGDPWTRMAHLYETVAATVANAARRGVRPIVASGDCTTSFGTVAGLQRAGFEPSIVWYDAHGDVNTVESSPSGYLGGVPLRMLTGVDRPLMADRLGLRDIPEERITLVDGRDLDPPEADYLKHSAIRQCPVDDVAIPDGPIYLHIDFDVVGDLPGLLFPAPGGPSLTALTESVRKVIDTGRVEAIGAACTWRPDAGNGERVRPVFG